MKKVHFIKFGLGLTLAIASVASYAADTANIVVTATVDPSCTITAAPLSFGKYNPLNAADTASTSSLTLACVKNSKPTVTLSYGGNTAGQGGTERRMTNGTDFLAYEVYKPLATDPLVDLANTQCTGSGSDTVIWGADAASGLHPLAAADANPQNYFLCGVIKAGQTGISSGAYSDTLIATVSF